MNKVLIFGGGTQLGIVVDIIEKQGIYTVAGIIDSKASIGTFLCGYPVLGDQKNIASIVENSGVTKGIISVGDNCARYKIYNEVTTLLTKVATGFEWINAIHPTVSIGRDVKLGKGILAMANVVFNPNAIIGNFTAFYTGAIIEHDNNISGFASVSAGSTLGGKVTMHSFSAITLGCTVFDRVTIGYNSVIGSGSLVTKDIPRDVLAYGSPAKVIKTRLFGEKFLK